MSNSDSFIEEVTEEVRRDRLYAMLRRYGWIAGLVIVLIVGGAAFSEYRKAQARAQAEALGDGILAALAQTSPRERQARLALLEPTEPGAQVVVDMLSAAEAQQAGDTGVAVEALDRIAVNTDVPEIYRQVAAFKSLVLQADTMDPATRRQQLEAMASPGAPLALLAQEQIGLMDVAQGDRDAALARFQAILSDAGASADLQERALQVIVALGGTPDLTGLSNVGN